MVQKQKQEENPHQRRAIRHKLRLRIHIKLDRSYQSWSKNISEGGVCFDIPEKVEVGREVVVAIYLKKASAESPVTAIVRVVWTEQTPKGFRHGGQFYSFVEDGLDRLREHLKAADKNKS